MPTQPEPQAALEWQQTRLTGADALAVDTVALRHLGVSKPQPGSLLRTAAQWFGGSSRRIEVIGEGLAKEGYARSTQLQMHFPARRQLDSGRQLDPVTIHWYDGGRRPDDFLDFQRGEPRQVRRRRGARQLVVAFQLSAQNFFECRLIRGECAKID